MNSHAQKIGMVGLLKSGWHFFKHKNAHLMLLLPDAYLRRIASDARSLADALSICGFSTAHLNQVLPKDWPLVLSSTTRKTSTSCINALKDMLIKKAEAPSLHWNIYLAGHGVAASRRRDATLTLLPETAQIAGLNFMEFDQLMSFLNGKTDDDIQASFLNSRMECNTPSSGILRVKRRKRGVAWKNIHVYAQKSEEKSLS